MSYWAIDRARLLLREASQQCLPPTTQRSRPPEKADFLIDGQSYKVQESDGSQAKNNVTPDGIDTSGDLQRSLQCSSQMPSAQKGSEASLLVLPVLGKQPCLSVGCGRN